MSHGWRLGWPTVNEGGDMKFAGLVLAASLVLSACQGPDAGKRSNDKPRVNNGGVPTNCRALVQSAVDGYRSGKYSVADTMASLERNCGAVGQLWAD